MIDSWLQDIRYAGRLLRRNPLFALTAVVSLAIGIGANTTIFTIANALLFKPPAGVVEPGRLVDVGRSQDGQGFDNGSYPNYLDIRARNTVFTDIYAYRIGAEPMSLGGKDGAERIFGDMVSTNYFTVLGTRPHLGRLFRPEDGERPGATPLALLSHHFWLRHFNGDPAIVGTTLQLNGRPFTVIGVAPEGFHGTTVLTADLWVPVNMVGELAPSRASLLTSRDSAWLVMGARLKPGVSVRQAQAELANIGRALEQEYPDANRGKGLRVVALSPIPGNGAPVAAFMAVLMGIVRLVLAIACANVAGVLLARATARRREIAVRLAIGAGRGRLIRQMLVESMLLFLIGGGAGLALARVMTDALVSLLPSVPIPIDLTLPLDERAVAFTLGLSLVAALLSGLAPALDASKAEVVGGLKSNAQGGPERTRLRNAFVVAQVASSIVLVVGAGLFVRALQRAADDRSRVRSARRRARQAGPLAGRLHPGHRASVRARGDPARACDPRRAVGDPSGDHAARRRRSRPRRVGGARRRAAEGAPLLRCRLERRHARLLRDDEDGAGVRARLHGRRSRGHAVGRDRQPDGGAAVVAGAGCDR